MKVFVLGGAGRHGRRSAYLLSSRPEVTELVIGARDLDSARAVAGRLGPKASICAVDARDESGLAAAIAGSRILVNASGPYFETLLPALRAAIAAGVHYCDFSEDGRTVEQAFATRRGGATLPEVIAVLGIGEAPGITNLMALHAARQLDRAEDIVVGWTDDFEVVYRSVQENSGTICTSGHVDASLQATLNASTGQIRTFNGGRWMDEAALGRAVAVGLPTGQQFSAFPLGWAEPVTLPRSIPMLRSVTSLVNLLPPQMNELMRAEASFIAEGRLRPREASIDMLEWLNVEPARWLSRPQGMMVGSLFAMARGIKDGQPAVCGVVPNWSYRAVPDWVEGLSTGAPCCSGRAAHPARRGASARRAWGRRRASSRSPSSPSWCSSGPARAGRELVTLELHDQAPARKHGSGARA